MAVNAPIWKDTFKAIPSGSSPYEYSINLKTGRQVTSVINGVTSTTDEIITVFSGKAWVRPGEPDILININKVAQNYLYSDLPDLRTIVSSTTYENKYAYRQFYLVHGGNTVETYNFLMDWSYVNTGVTANTSMSMPINGHGAPNMIFLSTLFNSEQKVVTTLSISGGSSYDTTHCGSYAVYYLNRYGGWDSFLIEGQVVKTDKYKRYQMKQSYDNTTLTPAKKTYNNEITETYKLVTGWLSDSESDILAEHLLSTNNAYLHNLVTGDILPINVTDASAQYKTYKNQGRKKVNYTINVEGSQTKNIVG